VQEFLTASYLILQRITLYVSYVAEHIYMYVLWYTFIMCWDRRYRVCIYVWICMIPEIQMYWISQNTHICSHCLMCWCQRYRARNDMWICKIPEIHLMYWISRDKHLFYRVLASHASTLHTSGGGYFSRSRLQCSLMVVKPPLYYTRKWICN